MLQKLHAVKLSQAEQEMQMWQTAWDEFNQQAAASAQRAQVEQNTYSTFRTSLANTHNRESHVLKLEQQQQQTNEIPEALLQLQEH